MTETAQSSSAGFIRSDTWAWWEARRLRYNLALAAAGWIAYGLALAISYSFGQTPYVSWNGALGMTLFLGLGFLVLMGIANICYLLGAISESIIKPADVDAFRRSAFALGFWGSLAVPFLFPLTNLAMLLIGGGADF